MMQREPPTGYSVDMPSADPSRNTARIFSFPFPAVASTLLLAQKVSGLSSTLPVSSA